MPKKGYKQTEEHKIKLSKAISGDKCYWYNREFTDEHKNNISKNKKGISTWTEETKKLVSEQRGGKGNSQYKHGWAKTKLYSTWKNMKTRCYNIKNNRFKYYGGKGIIICDEWLNSFETFKDWALNSGYEEGLTIDRIDFNNNYEPGNCQWLTRSKHSKKSNMERNHTRPI